MLLLYEPYANKKEERSKNLMKGKNVHTISAKSLISGDKSDFFPLYFPTHSLSLSLNKEAYLTLFAKNSQASASIEKNHTSQNSDFSPL